MTCPVCGCWSPDDSETGYGADELCPSCKDDGFMITADGHIVHRDQGPEDVDEFDQVRR